jgi:hypothetical protein
LLQLSGGINKELQMAKRTAAKSQTDGTVNNLRDLAKLCGVTEFKLKKLRSLGGFPMRPDRSYDAEEVLHWIAAGCPPSELFDADTPAPETEPAPSTKTETTPDGVTWLEIRVPIATPDGYIARQTDYSAPAVQTRLRDPDQIRGMQHLHAGCRDAHVQLENGKHVDTRPEVFRWLFGVIGTALRPAAK